MIFFKQLKIDNWRQFEAVDISFENQVTILTGANGCGKTSLLNILGNHFGWSINFVATPYLGKKKQKRFWSDVNKDRGELDAETYSNARAVGVLTYSNGTECTLNTPQLSRASFQISYSRKQGVSGLTIPSHRPVAVYQVVKEVPLAPKTSAQHYQEFQQLMLQTYKSSEGLRKNPGAVMKQSLVAFALLGPGNQTVQPNVVYQRLFEKFQDVLRTILPKEIGFQHLEVHPPEVLLVTNSGRFTLDAMSGGINSIVTIAWQILMHSSDNPNSTIVIDEPENHLHPSMQRSLIPSLASAFPTCRFIVATHSPFIVTSMDSALVHGLYGSGSHGIMSKTIELANLGGSPNAILRDVLNMPSLMPVWAEEKLQKLVEQTKGQDAKEVAKQIYEEMRQLGMVDHISDFSKKSEVDQ